MTGDLSAIERFLRETTAPGAWRTTGFLPDRVTQILRQPLLVCAEGELREPPAVPDLQIVEVTAASELSLLRENLELNARGFDASAPAIADSEAAEFGRGMGSAMAFTARLREAGAAAGMYLPPHAGVTELVGIATLSSLRGKGIAAALTAAMTAHALRNGVDVVFLITDNPVAQRVYERLGFQVAGSLREGVPG